MAGTTKEDRFPRLLPSHLSGPALDAYKSMNKSMHAMDGIFTWQDEKGGLYGPQGLLLRTPAYQPILSAFASGQAVLELEVTVREVVILTCASWYRSEWMLYTHERLAAKRGLEESVVRAIATAVEGGVEGLSEKQAAARGLTLAMLGNRKGKLDDEHWKKARQVLSEEECLGVMHFAGHYAGLSMICNASGLEVPRGEPRDV